MRAVSGLVLTVSLVCALAAPAAGEERWTSLGPPGGPFYPANLVVDPFTPATLYATAWGEAGPSGLWKSSDGGRHWRSINAGLERPYIDSIVADPFHPDTLFAVVNLPAGASLRRSDDAGESWTEVLNPGPGGGGMGQLIADPAIPNALWFHSSGSVGRSDDGGATWNVVHVGNGGSAMDIAVDPLDPEIVYHSDSYFLWKSTDRGVTWNGLYGPNSQGFDWVVPAPRPPAVLYARPTLTYGAPPAPFHCVRSDDKGATWTPMPLPDPEALCIALIVDPLDSLHVWVLDHLKGRLYVSTDGGATWPEVHEGLPLGFNSPFRRDARTGALYAAAEGGIARSDDGGETWEDASRGIVSTKVELLSAVPGGSGGRPVILAQARLQPMKRSADGGRTWHDLSVNGSVSGSAIAVDPADPAHLFLAGSYLLESRDAGRTWTRLGSPPWFATNLVVNPANPRVLYLSGPGAKVFRSRNGGRTWQPARAGLPVDPPCDRIFCHDSQISDFTIDPVDPRLLVLVLEGQVFRSTDAGRHWRPASLPTGVTVLAQHPRSRVLYAAGSTLARSTDGGATWTEIGELPALLRDLLVDPRGSGALYAAGHDAGVFRSTDQGRTWEPVSEGLPFSDVHLLALDPNAPGLFAAVGAAGIWGRRF
jgi:photosystem II stability/assembly factor-like uncharacterized protein